MDKLSLRAPVPEDLRLALLEVRRLHVAAPALVSLLVLAILVNALTALAAVALTTYLNQLFLRLKTE